MAYHDIRKGVHRTVMTLGMAFLLIGVVMLTVSSQVFILGVCFLGIGALGVLSFLMVTVSACVKKSMRSEDEENQTQTNARNTARQPEVDVTQFEAPRYEDVMLCGTATVWTVTLGPPPDVEPPPYHSSLAARRGVFGEFQLSNPTLLRISSDIHDLKRSGFIPEERWPEPLTPPPTYNESMTQWEDVFEPSHEEG